MYIDKETYTYVITTVYNSYIQAAIIEPVIEIVIIVIRKIMSLASDICPIWAELSYFKVFRLLVNCHVCINQWYCGKMYYIFSSGYIHTHTYIHTYI